MWRQLRIAKEMWFTHRATEECYNCLQKEVDVGKRILKKGYYFTSQIGDNVRLR